MSERFGSPEAVLTDLTQLQLGQRVLSQNRTLINNLANGDAPLSEEERRQQNVKSNFNSLDLTRICSNATNQINAAFFRNANFFKVRVDMGPQRTRAQVGSIITEAINKRLKRSRLYRHVRESAHAQVVLHGPGPLVWKNKRTPIPSEAGVEDVLIPSGTLTSMANLDRWAVHRELTWAELQDMAFGKVADPGWDKGYVAALVNTLYKYGYQPIYQGNRWMFPEKMAEDIKEGAFSAIASANPTIYAWDFFYKNKKTEKWDRCMVLDYGSVISSDQNPDGMFKENDEVIKKKGFLYRKENYADDWSEICHWYIGNCSNVAPYRYHSIRSIGYLLYGVCMIQNKLQNRLTDHMFQSLLTWFRNVSDDNREKIGLIDLQNFGVLPDGVSIVGANERHEVDWNLIMMGMNQNRQQMAASSSAFLPDMAGNPSDEKTMTATESLIRQNQSVTLTTAVLSQLTESSEYEYREICRRFCIKGNPDPMAKAFREEIQRAGVPLEYLDVDKWEIIPERTAGGGNKAQELNVTQALMQVAAQLPPESQRQIQRRYILALTDSAEEAMALVPDAPETTNNDVDYANMVFAVLMVPAPMPINESANPVVMATTLIQQSQIALKQAQASLSSPAGIPIAAQKVAGLKNVEQAIFGALQRIAMVESQREIAKGLEKAFKELDAEINRTAEAVQAAEEQMQPANGMTAEEQHDLQVKQANAQLDMQIKQANAAQKHEQKQLQWSEENQRRNATTQADIQRKSASTAADLQSMLIKSKADAAIKLQQAETATSE